MPSFSRQPCAFSSRGFDGVGVDDIAAQAQVNKAMIYYHFADKLALYRAVVGDMLGMIGATATAIADSDQSPQDKLNQFIANFVTQADARPWFPTMMLREISEGAPHLDVETFGLMKKRLPGVQPHSQRRGRSRRRSGRCIRSSPTPRSSDRC